MYENISRWALKSASANITTNTRPYGMLPHIIKISKYSLHTECSDLFSQWGLLCDSYTNTTVYRTMNIGSAAHTVTDHYGVLIQPPRPSLATPKINHSTQKCPVIQSDGITKLRCMALVTNAETFYHLYEGPQKDLIFLKILSITTLAGSVYCNVALCASCWSSSTFSTFNASSADGSSNSTCKHGRQFLHY